MLTVTPTAAYAIRSIVSSSPVPQGGLKISSKPTTETESVLELSIVEGPTSSDSVVDAEGSRVFVEESAVSYLDDKVLDAEVESGQVRFSLREQGSEAM